VACPATPEQVDPFGDAVEADAFKKFAQMLRSHLDGILPWTKIRVSNGAVEGMNNKIKSISHRSFGFRTAENFIAAIYHCCARLPLPSSANYTFRTEPKFPGLVGTSAAALFRDAAAFDRMITVAYAVEDTPDPFVMTVSGIAHHKLGTEWYGRVAERARTGLSPQQVASLLLG